MTYTTSTHSAGYTHIRPFNLLQTTEDFINKYRQDFEALAGKDRHE